MKTLFKIFILLSAAVFLLCTTACDDPQNNTTPAEDNTTQTGIGLPTDEEIAAFTFDKVEFPKGINWAGLRCSPYGFEQDGTNQSFPTTSQFNTFASKMAASYPGSKGTFVWIVGVIDDAYNCNLNFPVANKNLKNITDTNRDDNTNFLKMAEKNGYDVWLQVESGNADLYELAWIILNKYKKYSCVKGFGVDVEWYKPAGTKGRGSKISDATAEKLNKLVKMIDPSYTVFFKHWMPSYMPPSYRSDLIFVTDSQGLRSLENYRESMTEWATKFSKNPVFLQIGYDRDESIWGNDQYENPTQYLGTYISQDFINKNPIGIIWVDFTLRRALK